MGLSVNIGFEMEEKQYLNATRELLCSGQQFCGDSVPPHTCRFIDDLNGTELRVF